MTKLQDMRKKRGLRPRPDFQKRVKSAAAHLAPRLSAWYSAGVWPKLFLKVVEK